MLEHCVLLRSVIILPYINYGLLVWGFANIDIIFKLQKKIVRLIDRAFFLEHTEKLFKKYNLLKVHDLVKYRCLVFYFKLKNEMLPTKIESLFICPSSEISVNQRRLRSNDSNLPLILHTTNTRSGENCLRYYLPTYINSCHTSLIVAVELKTLVNFKKIAKNTLLDNYSIDECQLSNCYSCSLKIFSQLL